MTVKLSITSVDKSKNQQKRYAKYLAWGDAFGIALQEVSNGQSATGSDVDYTCVVRNQDGSIVLQNEAANSILLNGEPIGRDATIENGDVVYLTHNIQLSFKIHQLTGKNLFKSSRSSKEPIIISVEKEKKKEESDPAADFNNPVGHEIDGYFFEDILNYGSMGIVYKGVQKSLNRPVAIKSVAPQNMNNRTLVKRFMNMANLAWRLNHPYIVQIYDTGISQDFKMHYVVMEHVEGETLREMLNRSVKLDVEASCKVISELASALSFAHRQNIIHRDVNPSNIIITKDNFIKLIGLALSKIVDPNEERIDLTMKGQAMGTLGYISPEQAKNAADVDSRTDIYSLGVIFYECLCGKSPYDPEALKDPNKYVKALRNRPKIPPHKVSASIPESLSNIVMKCLEPNPAKRYQKAEEVLHDIKVYTEAKQFTVAQKRIRAMFPKTPQMEGYDFHITFEPMEQIGGDFYDFVKLGDGKWGIVIGDVTGHGVEAAVVMGMVKSIVKLMAKNLDSSAQALELTNREVHPDMDNTTFTTIAYGILDTRGKAFCFSRAGHNPLILYNPERDPSLTTFSPKGTIVGVPWSLNCEEVKIDLQEGDVLIQFTDGITEAKSKSGEDFGFERLCETIEQSNTQSLKQLDQTIREAVADFSKGSKEEADDITLLMFKMS